MQRQQVTAFLTRDTIWRPLVVQPDGGLHAKNVSKE